MERKAAIPRFYQDESESLSDTCERFKLLLRKCLNHNMSFMEQMIHFIIGLIKQTRMLLDASSGGTLRSKTDDEVKMLI